MAGGTISECSFSFRCDKDSWPSRADLLSTFGGIDMDSLPAGVPIRMLEDLTLFDASAVAQPAYGGGVTPVGADISSMPVDPAATRPHMEGVSIPNCLGRGPRKRRFFATPERGRGAHGSREGAGTTDST